MLYRAEDVVLVVVFAVVSLTVATVAPGRGEESVCRRHQRHLLMKLAIDSRVETETNRKPESVTTQKKTVLTVLSVIAVVSLVRHQ